MPISLASRQRVELSHFLSSSMRYKTVLERISIDSNSSKIVPKKHLIFEAFRFCKLSDVKVVILGQDPYPNPLDACGLAFSVPEDRPIPASLRNIFKELVADLGVEKPVNGDLTSWAEQGVLLLNTVLTTEAGKSLAHQNRGWEEFTDKVMRRIVSTGKPLVIMAWGRKAQDKVDKLRLHENVLVLEGGHPSPLNRTNNFKNGNYFSKANDWLERHEVEPIDWRLY